jgi:hypothetical protein
VRKLALLALAGCGVHPSVAPVSNVAAPSRPYAALFEQGRSWRYAVAPTGAAALEVTCRVVAVGHFPGGASSRIDCDGDTLDVLVGAIWIETDRGLYYGSEPLPDGAAPELDELDLMLPTMPRAGTRNREFEDGGDETTIRQDGDRWCVDSSIYGIGGGGGESWCFDRDGIASGSSRDSSESDDGPSIEYGLTFQRVR